MSLEQLDAHIDSISSSTMSTVPTTVTDTCSSQLLVGSTSSSAGRQAIPLM